MLSHGVTLSVRTWFHQLEPLPKEGFRTIAFDHRGHGQSVLGEAGHSLDNLADDVRTVLEGLDLRDAVLVGHSMGGVAVQSFVIRYPELAAERVARHRACCRRSRRRRSARARRGRSRGSSSVVEPRARHRSWCGRSRTSGLLAARLGFGKDPHPSHVELVRQMMLACPPETRRDAPRVLIGLDLTGELPNVDIPTLVIGGTADVLTPPADARRIARLIPGARLELFAGGGHMLMLERTDELDQLIVDFAREVGAVARRRRRERSTPCRRRCDSGRGRARRALDRARAPASRSCCFPTGTVGVGRGARRRAGDPRDRAARSGRAPSTRVDAVVLTGGSAFGLATADGVMRYLAEQGQGYPTAGGPVPIVPDRVRSSTSSSRAAAPGADDGYAAAAMAARDEPLAVGPRRRRRAARRSGSGAGANTRCRAGSASRSARVDDAHVVRARGRQRGRRRHRCRRRRSSPARRAPPDAPGFPTPRAVRGEGAQHDARGRRRPTRVLDKVGVPPARAERARRPRPRAAPRAHPLRRRPRVRVARPARSKPTSTACASRPPTSSPQPIRDAPG